MMKNMHDPHYRENLEDKLKDLKQDPELAPIMQEIEQGGPAAMMKCATRSAGWFWLTTACWDGLATQHCVLHYEAL